MKIITIGDNVVDCYLDQAMYYPGGNCVNVAVNCKRNGVEKVHYIGIFATDDKASHIKKSLVKEEVQFNLSRVVQGISGQPRVNLLEDGDRVFIGGPKNTVQHIVKLRLVQEDYEFIKEFDVCHSSCYSFLEEELPTLSKYIKISFDFSDQYDINYVEKVCPYISYAFFSGADLSEDEIEELIKNLKKYNLEVIGITRGGKPAIFEYNGSRYYQKVKEVEIVDTMGAGDSFIAGFLSSFNKNNIQDALEIAAEKASITCGFYGGFGYPEKLE